jgi:dTDP-4-amino-4,6-dideoxygalactose transaminase
MQDEAPVTSGDELATRDDAGRPVRRIPLAQPWIGERERELVLQVLSSDVLALGHFAERFEEGVAALAGRTFGVACSSGTAGLHMSIRALGIADGDEVITSPFSFVASANCVLYERALPRFVDIDESTLGLDPDLVAAAAGPRTRAILPVHVFGRPCQIDAIEHIADRRGWRLIEDACEAFGSSRNKRPAGSFGDVSVFAFYPNKQVTTGEGGVVVTDDAALASTLRSLRNQGRDDSGTWLRHVRLGYNYRLDELSAAIGVAQLERIEELRAGRVRVVSMYRALLERFEWIQIPAAGPGEVVDWFVYVVRLDPWIDRTRLIEDLDRVGVPTRPYFNPLHLQPIYRQAFGFRGGEFPVAERIAAGTLALPFSARLPDRDIEYVVDMLATSVDRQARG